MKNRNPELIDGKTQRQLMLDVANACWEIESAKLHRFDGLFNSLYRTFELLRDRYGWSDVHIDHYYSEKTVEMAEGQGWRRTARKSKARRRRGK